MRTRGATAYGLARLALRLVRAGAWRRPPPRSVAERLQALPGGGLPLAAPVEIRWNDRLVPFIAAGSDRDLAVALGVVHAHLRLAQMELLRRIARGRLAEVFGTAAVAFDHTVRVIDLTRAVPAIEAMLSDATRDWLDGFVAGINHHIASTEAPPLEFRLLGITPARWTIGDVLALARLAAADVNWLVWRNLLRLPRGPDWPELWRRLLADGTVEAASGSNAVAIAGARIATGQPWLAGDPHLPLSLPSPWLAAAYRSPSYNVAGLMIPGIPVMAIGRNRWLAWGGTNLHAASSELFDVSGVAHDDIRVREAWLPVRGSRPRRIALRETPHGPILSDAPLFPAGGANVALRWVGHEPSDEIGALLAINRACDAAELRRAVDGLAVPGQNIVFAARCGAVGHLIAAHLPRRAMTPPEDVISRPAAAAAWSRLVTATDLPADIDPAGGLVVSANQRPPAGDIPVGWFFSPPDRAERLASLLGACGPIGFPELAELLTDVAAPAALRVRDLLCAAAVPRNCRALRAAIAGWDGRYDPVRPGRSLTSWSSRSCSGRRSRRRAGRCSELLGTRDGCSSRRSSGCRPNSASPPCSGRLSRPARRSTRCATGAARIDCACSTRWPR